MFGDEVRNPNASFNGLNAAATSVAASNYCTVNY